jgi:hypothetical protein
MVTSTEVPRGHVTKKAQKQSKTPDVRNETESCRPLAHHPITRFEKGDDPDLIPRSMGMGWGVPARASER